MHALSRFLRIIFAVALSCIAWGAAAQAYPSKPIRWIVAYPPGGGTDFLARTVGAQLSRQTGEAVVIENRPGGAGIIASEASARAPADGYTIFSGDNGTLVYNAALFKKPPYDATRDFAPVGMMARFPLVLIAGANAPFSSPAQLIDMIKKKPGQLNYASPGLGSPHHLAMELLKERARLFVVHVPYRGSGPAIQDLLGGQIPLFVADTAAALPLIRAGKVKAIATFSRTRFAALADTPTFIELGYEGVEAYGWQGLVVPSRTPREVIARLNTELVNAIQSPEISRKLTEFGLELTPGNPDTMARYLAAEIKRWHPLIKDRGISLD